MRKKRGRSPPVLPTRASGEGGFRPREHPPAGGAILEKVSPTGTISAEQVRKGLPMKALDDLARLLNVDRASLADILGTSIRALQRRAAESERLGAVGSDRLARVRRILDLATR